MNYVEQTDLVGLMPASTIVQALDDNGDGVADSGVFESLADTVSRDIDSRLGQRYTTPFAYPYPAVVTNAARVLAQEALYTRRGKNGDANPFTKQADAIRKKLDAIGSGTEPLTPQRQRAQPSASAITEPSKTAPKGGQLSA